MTGRRSGAKVEALLFDLGGIVITIDWERVFARWAPTPAERDRLRARFAMDEPYCRHERGELAFAGYAKHLRQHLQIDLDDAAMLDGWNDIFVGPVPGMADVLAAAGRRWPMDVFSNTNAVHQMTWTTRYADILAPFRDIYSSSALGVRKPEPEAFRLVAGRMGTAPERILFFDDTEENIDGARAAGLQAVRIDPTGDVAGTIGGVLESVA
ncbi:MAG: HAD family phosphatase [Proteobacteria bacterium]|nr:HAD family phosphatase [Pseudomonadota bacterium]